MSSNLEGHLAGLKASEAEIMGDLERATIDGADPRWIAIAKTDFEKAFMAATRSLFTRWTKR